MSAAQFDSVAVRGRCGVKKTFIEIERQDDEIALVFTIHDPANSWDGMWRRIRLTENEAMVLLAILSQALNIDGDDAKEKA